MSRFLGIDLGTTFLKGAILDLDGRCLSHIRRVPFPAAVAGLPPGHCEIDPAGVLEATRRLIGELAADAPDATGLVVSSQMHCVVLTDDAGRPRSNVISWKDQRGLDPHPSGSGTYLDVVRDRIPAGEYDQTGRELRSGTPAVTLAWLNDRGLVPDGAFAAALPDFVLANLCRTAPTTDPTHAAAAGLFDLSRGDWHRELIDRLGLSRLRWPCVRPFATAVGSVEVGGRRLTCYAPVGDQQSALMGAGVREGELSVNVATGAQVSVLSRDRRAGDFSVRPYPDGLWLNTIVRVPAGRSLAVLMGLVTEIGQVNKADIDPWDIIADAVARVAETDLRVDLAFFDGPFGDRGGITNIGEHNLTVGHVFSAAFRNMAENFAACALRLNPARNWQRVVFSGGLAHRFPALRDAVARALRGETFRVCPSSEDALRGLLGLALVCGGRVSTVREACESLTECE